ncbi:MAG: MASE3 domain-containing protein [Candidatus Thorarchaeota archaeon]
MEKDSEMGNVTLFVVLAAVAVIILFEVSTYSYLLFHSAVELFSIIIAMSVFVIGLNADRFSHNEIFRALGIGYLFVGILDTLHLLAFKGMGVFPGFDANLPTQLWLAARILECSNFLLAPLIYKRSSPRWAIFSGNLIYSITLTGLIFSGYFPVAYIEGVGLTLFKVGTEYVLIVLLLVAMVAFTRYDLGLEKRLVRLITYALISTALAEISFTLYVDVYGIMNMIGHYLKLISFYFIYRAMVVGPLFTPYEVMFRKIKRDEEALRIANKTMRHDIINELAIIQTSLELYSEMGDDSVLKEANEATKRGINLIQSIKTLENSDNRALDANFLRIHDMLLTSAQDSKLKVSIEGSSECLASDAMSSVFHNIIQNAEQHSNSDRIEISLKDEKGFCIISFRDFGNGIPEDLHEKIFEEGFTYGENAGTGMGLFLARRIVDRYNGTIKCLSGFPNGSVFEVRLPAP